MSQILNKLIESLEVNFLRDSEILMEASEDNISDKLDKVYESDDKDNGSNMKEKSTNTSSNDKDTELLGELANITGYDKMYLIETAPIFKINEDVYIIESSTLFKVYDKYNGKYSFKNILDEVYKSNELNSKKLYVHLESNSLEDLQRRIRLWTTRLKKTVDPERRQHFQEKLTGLQKEYNELLMQNNYPVVK